MFIISVCLLNIRFWCVKKRLRETCIYMYILLIFQVCVEGNIGSGKTTFLEYFKKFSNIIEVKTKYNHEPPKAIGSRPAIAIVECPAYCAPSVVNNCFKGHPVDL